jgi:hypothetical protein
MEKNLDFADIITRNHAFQDRAEESMLTRSDLSALARVVEVGNNTSSDGDNRIYAAQRIVHMGDANAARSIIAISEGQTEENIMLAFDMWADGTVSGVFERNKDYSANEDDFRYFNKFIEFFSECGMDFPFTEASDESLQELAFLFRTEPDVDIEPMTAYAAESGDFNLEGYRNYVAAYPALRDGAL